ncbi:hypothetical protein KIW84_062526 [Lathyrus oleraceus]|uniref:Uncharacterized protein n=1 Tax=Pisum sativum TaxID=3888 RepID=A0A9D5A5P8_PEA|nr:hypothetical protein KIW84_062526 [Pisum sativum]
MRICLHHGLEDWVIIHTYYNGLLYNTRLTVDAAAGGALMDKPYNEAYQLIENMAQNHCQWGGERTPVEKSQTKGGMYEISSLDHVHAKVDALVQKLDNLTIPPTATVAAVTPNCWKNHPNFSYKNNNALYAPGQAPAVPLGYQKSANNAPNMPRKSNLELMMESFIATQAQTNKDFLNQNIHTSEQLKQLASKVDALATHNKMLETQISQVAQHQASTTSPTRTFPGQPQPNSKGHANVVILRSGKEVDRPVDPRLQNPAMYQKPDKTSTEQVNEPKEIEDNTQEAEEKEKPHVPPPPYKPLIMYPQRLARSKTASQFRKFVELMKQLNITIPFIEAITQMPSYAKFIKESYPIRKRLRITKQLHLLPSVAQ